MWFQLPSKPVNCPRKALLYLFNGEKLKLPKMITYPRKCKK